MKKSNYIVAVLLFSIITPAIFFLAKFAGYLFVYLVMIKYGVSSFSKALTSSMLSATLIKDCVFPGLLTALVLIFTCVILKDAKTSKNLLLIYSFSMILYYLYREISFYNSSMSYLSTDVSFYSKIETYFSSFLMTPGIPVSIILIFIGFNFRRFVFLKKRFVLDS